MRPIQLEYFEDGQGFWRWNLKHSNGRILAASSEGFVNRSGAKRNFACTAAAFTLVAQKMAERDRQARRHPRLDLKRLRTSAE